MSHAKLLEKKEPRKNAVLKGVGIRRIWRGSRQSELNTLSGSSPRKGRLKILFTSGEGERWRRGDRSQ